MLGLEHSGVVAASMQPRQGTNGTYNLPGFTTRTLSADDVAGIRAIYGPRSGLGSIAGRVGYNATTGAAAFGAHVFAEDVATGRVVGGNVAQRGRQLPHRQPPAGAVPRRRRAVGRARARDHDRLERRRLPRLDARATCRPS